MFQESEWSSAGFRTATYGLCQFWEATHCIKYTKNHQKTDTSTLYLFLSCFSETILSMFPGRVVASLEILREQSYQV